MATQPAKDFSVIFFEEKKGRKLENGRRKERKVMRRRRKERERERLSLTSAANRLQRAGRRCDPLTTGGGPAPTWVPTMPARSEIAALHLDLLLSPHPSSPPPHPALPQASGERRTGGKMQWRRREAVYGAHGEAGCGT